MLGIDVRNVPTHLLQPVALRTHARSPLGSPPQWRTASGTPLWSDAPSKLTPSRHLTHTNGSCATLRASQQQGSLDVQPLPLASRPAPPGGDPGSRRAPPHVQPLCAGTTPLPALALPRVPTCSAPHSLKVGDSGAPRRRRAPLLRAATLPARRSHELGAGLPPGSAPPWQPPPQPLTHVLGVPWNVAQNALSMEQTLVETHSLAQQAGPGSPGLPYLGAHAASVGVHMQHKCAGVAQLEVQPPLCSKHLEGM